MDKNYALREEVANSILHGAGALLSLLGIIALVMFSNQTAFLTGSFVLYGTTMFLMYLSSTLYHSATNIKVKKHFKTLDHCAIFLLIAGTYTPFTMVTLNGMVGNIIFAVIWIFAIIGVVLNAISVKKYHKLSLVCYIAMGWAIVFAIKPLIDNLHIGGLILLVLGGLSYTIGVAFYVRKSKYMHTIWHVFVLMGSVFHYFAILLFVAPIQI